MAKNRHTLSEYRRLILLWLLLFSAAGGLSLHTGSGACSVAENKSDSLVDSVLKRITEREAHLKTFTASFIQTQQNELLTTPLISKGILFYDRNGKMLMKITDPEPFVVLIANGLITMGNPASKRFKQKAVPGRETFLKRYLGFERSITDLKTDYDIQMDGECPETTCRLTFRPKKQSRGVRFQRIRVTVDTRLWLPTVILLEEPNADFTRFDLFYHTVNEPLPPNTFNPDLLKGEK